MVLLTLQDVCKAFGLNVILKTLLNPGDQVIAVAPYFVEYGSYVRNYDGELVVVNSKPDTFQIDIDAVCGAITEKTKAIILNSPNNPTGVIYSAETLTELGNALSRKQEELGTKIFIISDEPYRELAYDGAEVPFMTKFYKNTVVCYSWSKSLSLPGERIGYLLIPSQCDEFELLFMAASIATRVMGFVNAPSLFQLVAAKCADVPADVSGYDENRKLLYDGLTKCGFECVFPQGAFYIWMKTPEPDDKAFCEKAKKYDLILVPGDGFGCPGFFRMAYCIETEKVERSLEALRRFVHTEYPETARE